MSVDTTELETLRDTRARETVEREAAIEALAEPEAREGLAAFLERRPPRFHE